MLEVIDEDEEAPWLALKTVLEVSSLPNISTTSTEVVPSRKRPTTWAHHRAGTHYHRVRSGPLFASGNNSRPSNHNKSDDPSMAMVLTVLVLLIGITILSATVLFRRSPHITPTLFNDDFD